MAALCFLYQTTARPVDTSPVCFVESRLSMDQRRSSVSLEIKVLDIGDIHLESSFLVGARNMGITTTVPTFSYLILGGPDPIVVDTGYIDTEIMKRLGMTGTQTEEQKLENQLAKYGVKIKDVRWILHTHLHIDHA